MKRTKPRQRGRAVSQTVRAAEPLPPRPEPADHATEHGEGQGVRFNLGKPRYDLIPMEWLVGFGVLKTRGAIKYNDRNWERGMHWSFFVRSAFSHLIAFCSGERYDEETGCHHLVCSAWNIMCLMTHDARQIGTNDIQGTARLEWNDATYTNPSPELQAKIEAVEKQAAIDKAKGLRKST